MDQHGKMLILLMHIKGHEKNNTMLTVSSVVSGKLKRRALELCTLVWKICMKRIAS